MKYGLRLEQLFEPDGPDEPYDVEYTHAILMGIARDPGTWTGADIYGYVRPFSREEAALTNVIDMINFTTPRGKGAKKPEPQPRPVKEDKEVKQFKPHESLTQEEIDKMLAAASVMATEE